MIIVTELKKLWNNGSFLLYLLILLLFNVFLIWFFTQPNEGNIQPSAYKQIAEDLKHLDMDGKNEHLAQKLEKAQAMVVLDEINAMARMIGTEEETYKNLVATHEEIIENYSMEYARNQTYEYTSSNITEFEFLQEIYSEFTAVYNYDGFLKDIEDSANNITQISIFQTENSFIEKNISATVNAYAHMQGIEVDYAPQKGIVTALNFNTTDIILVSIIILISVILIMKEKETGVVNLIRSTPAGREKTAFLKIMALALSLFVIVFFIYGINLIYCTFTFGIDNLSASVQSVPLLMRSTLKISVLQYFFIFVIVKWLSALIFGIWIMLSMLFAKNLYGGLAISLIMPVAFYYLTQQISPTSSLNVLFYANPISYLQTNNILGNYRNLYWFNSPVNLVSVVIISVFIYVSVFLTVYFFGFKIGKFSQITSSVNFVPKNKNQKLTTVFKTEWRKLLLINFGVFIILFALGYQGYRVATTQIYLSNEETVYKEYMQDLTGVFTQEKHEFLQSEKERFEPLKQTEEGYAKNIISEQEYERIIYSNYNLYLEYKAYNRVINALRNIVPGGTVQLVYETGYTYLFGLDALSSDENLHMAILSVLLIVFALSGMFSIERISGMRKILYSTPLGREKTAKTKLIISAIFCAFVAAITSVPMVINAIRFYGLSGLFVPAKRLLYFANLPIFVLLIFVIILWVLMRLVACAFVGAVTLSISQKYSSKITVTVICLTIFLLPLILILMGVDILSYVSVYQLFNFTALLARGWVAIATLLIAIAMGCTCYWLCCHMINKYCWYFTDL